VGHGRRTSLLYLFVSDNFPDSCLIFTDGSVVTRSAGCCFFFVPSFSVSVYDNLPRFVSSSSAECWPILLALRRIIRLSSNKFSITTDSPSPLCIRSLPVLLTLMFHLSF